MDSACILAVFSARTFSFETFWAKAGDTSSALTRNPVDRLTTLFKMNQLEGLPLPSNVSPDEQPPKKGLFVSDQQARLKLQQHTRPATLAKLGEIKLKQIPQLNTANSSPLIRKHKEVLNLMMRTLSLDTYGLTWAQFIKGFGCGAMAVWLLMR